MTTYYKPSGFYSPISILFFILTCLIVIPILATAYSYAIWYIPIPYINLFITIGFGILVGYTVSLLAVKYGKVRSGKVASIFGLLAGLLALYVHWAVWVDLVINVSGVGGTEEYGFAISNIKIVQVIQLILSPSALFEIIGQIRETGTWGIKSKAISGTPLTIIWVLEALIIVIASFATPGRQSREPFCELNQKWFEKKELAFSFLDNPLDVLNNLKSGSQNVFDNLTRAGDIKKDSHSIFTLYANDTNENYLTIENKQAKLTDRKEIKFNDVQVTKYMSISEELSRKIEAI